MQTPFLIDRSTIDTLMLGEIKDRAERIHSDQSATLHTIQHTVDDIVARLGLPYRVKVIVVSGKLRCIKRESESKQCRSIF